MSNTSQDARIAELEGELALTKEALHSFVSGQVRVVDCTSPKNDDRRFVDEAAIACMAQLIASADWQTRGATNYVVAGWAYDTAEALAAERKRRGQR